METYLGPSTLNHGSHSILHSNTRSIRNKSDFVKDFFFDLNILRFTATFITLPFQFVPKIAYTQTVWLYIQADFNALNTAIRNFEWSCLLHGSVNEASNLFNDIFS